MSCVGEERAPEDVTAFSVFANGLQIIPYPFLEFRCRTPLFLPPHQFNGRLLNDAGEDLPPSVLNFSRRIPGFLSSNLQCQLSLHRHGLPSRFSPPPSVISTSSAVLSIVHPPPVEPEAEPPSSHTEVRTIFKRTCLSGSSAIFLARDVFPGSPWM